LNKSEKHNDAVAAFKESLRHNPSNANTYSSLAVTYNDLSDSEQAIHYANEAITHGAKGAVLVNSLNAIGVAYRYKRCPNEALEFFNRALEVDPNAINIHKNKGHVLLDQGDLVSGWAECGWELKRTNVQQHLGLFSQKMWQFEPLSGKSLTILAEQGVGDER